MTACPHHLIPDQRPKLNSDYVFFANLNLDSVALESYLAPFMELVSQRIGLTYKSSAKVSFLGINGILKLQLSDWLQFDDISIKLLHVETGLDILVTISTQIARSLLIRLLATTLVDDSHGMLFSSTEKGIFSFIVARLLLDLKHTLGEKMPNLKLIGVYHCQDEAINDTPIADFGVFNFSFGLAHDHYPVSIALPLAIFSNIKRSDVSGLNLIIRCGHIKAPMTFTLKTLRIDRSSLAKLSFGDLIIFDRARNTLVQGALSGPMCGLWQTIALSGMIGSLDFNYAFFPDLARGFSRAEDIHMEEIDVVCTADTASTPTDDKAHRNKLADIAKNIRVPLSIELSRLPFTLKELSEIKEGEIIDLRRKIDDPLDMVVEGKVIGHCQPVQIDGRLGIRVLNIEGESQKHQI